MGTTYKAGLGETVDMLADAGATVDREMKRIRFPRELILEQIAKAPSQVILYARDGKNDLDLTEDKVHLGTGGAAIKILDLATGLPRSSTLKNLYDLGRLVDHLDHIHFFLRPCIPTDIPKTEYDVNMFYACLKATGKHVMSGANDEAGLNRFIDMACKVLKGIEVDAEHLALEVIDTVGPAGNYMMSPHTMKHMRSEYFQGNGVSDRKSRHQWDQGGSTDTRERAKAIALKILASEETLYIRSDIDQSIREKYTILL